MNLLDKLLFSKEVNDALFGSFSREKLLNYLKEIKDKRFEKIFPHRESIYFRLFSFLQQHQLVLMIIKPYPDRTDYYTVTVKPLYKLLWLIYLMENDLV